MYAYEYSHFEVNPGTLHHWLGQSRGRKWGHAVSGWIVGMPLTSGPVIFFVALSHDVTFAANAALGVISGGLSLVAYALTYAWLATRFRWYIALTGGFLVFALTTTFLQNITFPLIPIFLAVCSAIVLGLRLMPNDAVKERATYNRDNGISRPDFDRHELHPA